MKILLVNTGGKEFKVHEQMLSKIKYERYSVCHLKNNIGKIICLLKNIAMLPESDVYITENLFYYPAFKKMITGKGKIVELNCGPALYKTLKQKGILGFFARFLLKYVDGIIILDKNLEKDIKKLGIKYIYTPLYLVNDDKKVLKNVKPSYDSKVFFTVGGNDYLYKGFDYTIEIFYNIWLHEKKARFVFYGNARIPQNVINKYPKEFVEKVERIEFEKDKSKLFGGKTIYIHSGRGDTFPLSSVEAMSCGIPSFISTTTGSHVIAKKVSNYFVYDMEKEKPEKVAEKILKFINKGQSHYYRISKKFKDIASYYSEDNLKEKHANKIKKFIEDIMYES